MSYVRNTQPRHTGYPPKRRPVSLALVAVTAVVVGAVGAGAYLLIRPSGTSSSGSLPPGQHGNCTPSAILVNPCRPWFGAAANGFAQAGFSKVAQFDYVQRLVGHRLDIFRDYHSPPGTALGELPLTSDELQMAKRPNTYIDVNWKPAQTWAQAGGGDPAVNAEIDHVAASIKSVAPHKIFMTIWWEPQNDVTGGTTCPTSPKATAGTPAEYIAMWRNVEQRFHAAGVTNVVWAMDYQAPYNGQWDCLVPQLWPGNNLVNWVLFDTYSRNSQTTWDNTVGRFYNVLSHDSSARVNFDSKPWGVGEFGTCSNNDVNVARDYYLQAKAALDANTYPRLKMYLAYDDSGGPAAGSGCLTNTDNNGLTDGTKQHNFNQFAGAVLSR